MEYKSPPQQRPIRCAVVTVSDTLTEETDRSGAFLRDRLERHGHEVAFQRIIPHELPAVDAVIRDLTGKVETVLLTGDMRVSTHDGMGEVLDARLEMRLPGFGALYQMLSYKEIGAGAMLERAAAGVCGGTLFFAFPGSLDAVKRTAGELILPELKTLAGELVRKSG